MGKKYKLSFDVGREQLRKVIIMLESNILE
jgi:hypothetical protein